MAGAEDLVPEAPRPARTTQVGRGDRGLAAAGRSRSTGAGGRSACRLGQAVREIRATRAARGIPNRRHSLEWKLDFRANAEANRFDGHEQEEKHDEKALDRHDGRLVGGSGRGVGRP